jgi:general secretion pathway protein I
MSRHAYGTSHDRHTTRRGRRRVRARQVAMTLLEVILAIAILGGSLAVLGEIVRAGTRAAREAKILSTAQLLADSLTAEICASTTTPETTDGVVDDFGGTRWTYTMQVEQVGQQGLLGIMVTVREDLDQSLQPTTFTLVRWMIDPQTELELETAAAEAAAASSPSTSSSSATSGASSSSAGSSSGASSGTTPSTGGTGGGR